MSTFFTVEISFSYRGFIAKKIDAGLMVSVFDLKDFSTKEMDILLFKHQILCDGKNLPESQIYWLGRRRHTFVLSGNFYKVSSKKFLIRPESKKDKSKIICSRYKNFEIHKGVASYVMDPSPEHDFAFIKMSPNSVLELSTEDDRYNKIIKYGDLN